MAVEGRVEIGELKAAVGAAGFLPAKREPGDQTGERVRV
jgi:hypothetical protein